MIKFECPYCAEKMEISDRKAGKFVECVRCREMIEVKEVTRRRERPKSTRGQEEFFGKDHLTIYEYLLYGSAFVCFPLLNILTSGFLYTLWSVERPTKAYQINQLALIIFLLQLIPLCCLCCIPAYLHQNR